MKIIINCCYGGWGISDAARKDLGIPTDWYIDQTDARHDPTIIALIEAKGSEYVSGPHAELRIVEIPENLKFWQVREYDGYEYIVASESEIVYIRGGE